MVMHLYASNNSQNYIIHQTQKPVTSPRKNNWKSIRTYANKSISFSGRTRYTQIYSQKDSILLKNQNQKLIPKH